MLCFIVYIYNLVFVQEAYFCQLVVFWYRGIGCKTNVVSQV